METITIKIIMKALQDQLNKALNESINSNKLISLIYNTFENVNGVYSMKTSSYETKKSMTVSVNLDDGKEVINTLTDEISDALGKIINLSPKGILEIVGNLGYSGNNTIDFKIVGTDTIKIKKLYHIASGKNVESIRKHGLVASGPTTETDKFRVKLGEGSFRKRIYKAVFGVKLKSQLKTIQRMFQFIDPHVIQFDGSDLDWYLDSLMSNHASSSVVTFDGNVPAEKIISITKL